MFQELAEYMGLQKLNERLKDPYVIIIIILTLLEL